MKELRAITRGMDTKTVEPIDEMAEPPRRATTRTIVKVQLPIASAEQVPLALIYNADRTVHCQVPVTEPLIARMGPGVVKGYFHALVDSAGTIEIEGIAPDQAW